MNSHGWCKYGLMFLFIQFSGNSFTQIEFSQSQYRIGIGTDAVTSATGTLNILCHYRIYDELWLQAGAGYMPFGILRDYSTLRSSKVFDIPKTDTLVSDSFFFNVAGGFTYVSRKDFMSEGVYFGFKYWKFMAQDTFLVNKYRGVAGYTYKFTLPYNFIINFNLGISMTKENVQLRTEPLPGESLIFHSHEFFGIGEKESRISGGFDLGLIITYNF